MQLKQHLYALIMVSISITFGILLSEYILSWHQNSIARSSKMATGMMHYHPELGWALTPNWKGEHSHHDFSVTYSTDEHGFRQQPREGKSTTGRKIALIGDSFTFGFGVNDYETFAAKLALDDIDNEYLNLGVPGYSTDQEYLLMQQQSKENINDYVLIFYLGNDIIDNALPHPLQAEPAKPFFEVNEGVLVLKNMPVPKTKKPAVLRSQTLKVILFGNELNQYAVAFDGLRQKSQILKLLIPQKANTDRATINAILDGRLSKQKYLLSVLFKSMQREAKHQQTSLSIAILPGRSYVVTPDSYAAIFQEYVRKYVIDLSTSLQINTIDIATLLRKKYEAGQTQLFHPNEGHLTSKGHGIVAGIIQKELIIK
ncbi:SGNH/GDSL hydrolase family protein [sulfur-oxidizing endosymbiont of Gigantopelta aegis]|uniref:SGNH/GDSL hydrolase family protein n=1 Tax=sulfur-oxidizing endosymbiont of Gigantopelta aegis TaxID=2794934 RepID=UPI0018DCE709|nr:SGNH/GDSL hydrolase family protein [sulfur-oxidizing endosymbiont of Gigantopelta aegis]